MATAARFPWLFGSAATELTSLFENAPMGIAQCDRDGRLTAMNPALTAMLGIDPQIILVPRFADIVSLEDHNLSPDIFRRLISSEPCSFQFESLLNGSNGPAKWLRWMAWGIRGSSHTPDCVLLLAEDVTEKRAQEQRFAKAEQWQVLGRMAGSIAHDFNNLLTGILLYCDLMLNGLNFAGPGLTTESTSPIAEGLCRPERLREYAEEIRSAGLQATGVVQQLLSVTRPRNPHPYPISLNAIAEQMDNLLLRLLGENIELSFHLDPALALVSLDPAQAQQVLLNLVLNARDAMPHGGRIQVETENCSVQVFRGGRGEPRAGGDRLTAIPCVLFVVRDNGVGMTEETRRSAFQAYFTTKAEGKGSGLGMTTVHSIVAACGGLVQVESAPGRGTSVIVLLPAASSRPIAPDTRQGSPQLV